MSNGIEELRKGAEALCEWDGPLRERLLFAARRFWSAYFFHHEWPEELARRSDAIVRELFERGPIRQTVATMPDAEVPKVASRLLEFIEDAELSLTGRRITACVGEVP